MGGVKRTLVWPAAVAGFAAFVFMIFAVSVTPLTEWTQEMGACRGAERVLFESSDGGETTRQSVTTRFDSTATTVTGMTCEFSDGEVRTVGNDETFLRGLLAAFLISFVPVFVIALAVRLVKRPE